MNVLEIMTPHVISVKPADTLALARDRFHEKRIHHLVVLDGDRVVGLLAYRDLLGKEDTEAVAEAMSTDVVTIEPWQSVRDAATLMIGRTHGCLPVVEEGKIRGVVTTTDLLRAVSHPTHASAT